MEQSQFSVWKSPPKQFGLDGAQTTGRRVFLQAMFSNINLSRLYHCNLSVSIPDGLDRKTERYQKKQSLKIQPTKCMISFDMTLLSLSIFIYLPVCRAPPQCVCIGKHVLHAWGSSHALPRVDTITENLKTAPLNFMAVGYLNPWSSFENLDLKALLFENYDSLPWWWYE